MAKATLTVAAFAWLLLAGFAPAAKLAAEEAAGTGRLWAGLTVNRPLFTIREIGGCNARPTAVWSRSRS
jgi:hypothetical protein